jgi:hypothetical protein
MVNEDLTRKVRVYSIPWFETQVVTDISFSINKSNDVNFLDASNNEIGNNKEKIVKLYYQATQKMYFLIIR